MRAAFKFVERTTGATVQYRCPDCNSIVAPNAPHCPVCLASLSLAHGRRPVVSPASESDATVPTTDQSTGRWARILGLVLLFAIWLAFAGPLTIAPRLSPGVSTPLADASFIVWLTLPLSFVTATISASRAAIAAACAHVFVWLIVVGFQWGSLSTQPTTASAGEQSASGPVSATNGCSLVAGNQAPRFRIQSAVPAKDSASLVRIAGSMPVSAIACSMQASHWSRSRMPIG
jgi:hypothetical protein